VIVLIRLLISSWHEPLQKVNILKVGTVDIVCFPLDLQQQDMTMQCLAVMPAWLLQFVQLGQITLSQFCRVIRWIAQIASERWLPLSHQ
jgi:hypothetical protein